MFSIALIHDDRSRPRLSASASFHGSIIAQVFTFLQIFYRLAVGDNLRPMTINEKETTYSERMEEPFPDVNEEIEKYTEQKATEEQMRYWSLYFKMIKALNMGRTHHVRTNSWGTPDKSRPDGTPFTKTTRASRIAVNRRRNKAAKLARARNR